jgi:hypothetical protein
VDCNRESRDAECAFARCGKRGAGEGAAGARFQRGIIATMRLAAIIVTLFASSLAILPGQARLQPPAQAQAQAQAQTQTPKPGQPVPLAQDPHFRLMYEDVDIQVYDAVIPPHQSTLLDQHDNNFLFVTFGKSSISVASPGLSPVPLDLPDGAVRFFEGGVAQTITNDSDRPFHNMTIVFANPQLTGRGCSCRGGAADAICQCPNAQPLAADWFLRIGQVNLRGVTLDPGATYEDDSTRTTRFLVAVTPFDILDASIHEPRNLQVRLPEGRFHWLAPGPHKIQNLNSQPVRFVSVEFYGTPKKEFD